MFFLTLVFFSNWNAYEKLHFKVHYKYFYVEFWRSVLLSMNRIRYLHTTQHNMGLVNSDTACRTCSVTSTCIQVDVTQMSWPKTMPQVRKHSQSHWHVLKAEKIYFWIFFFGLWGLGHLNRNYGWGDWEDNILLRTRISKYGYCDQASRLLIRTWIV